MSQTGEKNSQFFWGLLNIGCELWHQGNLSATMIHLLKWRHAEAGYKWSLSLCSHHSRIIVPEIHCVITALAPWEHNGDGYSKLLYKSPNRSLIICRVRFIMTAKAKPYNSPPSSAKTLNRKQYNMPHGIPEISTTLKNLKDAQCNCA